MKRIPCNGRNSERGQPSWSASAITSTPVSSEGEKSVDRVREPRRDEEASLLGQATGEQAERGGAGHAPAHVAGRHRRLVQDPAGGLLLAVKGAPEVIAARLAAIETSRGPCDADDNQRAWIRHAAEQLSEAGLRTLALAYRQLPLDDVDPAEQENDLVFVAVVGMHDDLRNALSVRLW